MPYSVLLNINIPVVKCDVRLIFQNPVTYTVNMITNHIFLHDTHKSIPLHYTVEEEIGLEYIIVNAIKA